MVMPFLDRSIASLFIVIIIEVIITLWVLKVSAEWAYGKKVSYSQALVQWLAMIVIQVIVLFLLSFIFALI
ncbi:MAG: hypothetical protein AB1467_01020 [Candidatus Diapherotrites archaeon]